jgi:hypothetical protein
LLIKFLSGFAWIRDYPPRGRSMIGCRSIQHGLLPPRIG